MDLIWLDATDWIHILNIIYWNLIAKFMISMEVDLTEGGNDSILPMLCVLGWNLWQIGAGKLILPQHGMDSIMGHSNEKFLIRCHDHASAVLLTSVSFRKIDLLFTNYTVSIILLKQQKMKQVMMTLLKVYSLMPTPFYVSKKLQNLSFHLSPLFSVSIKIHRRHKTLLFKLFIFAAERSLSD